MHRCAILDASPGPGPLDAFVGELVRGLTARGARVERHVLRDLTIAQCRGCFGCWVKTPGRCVIRDDGEEIVRSVVASDLLVLASPIVMGFTAALSRRASERLLPILHPFFQVVEGEVHHRPRYSRRPALALVHDGAGLDAEDEALLELLHRRMALNMSTRLALVASTARPVTEVRDALARV
jgi:multimeric flavodoxin WrbA